MKKLLFQFIIMFSLFSLILFFSAGTIFWLEGWVYIVSMGAFSVFHTLYLKMNDPELLERRRKVKPKEKWEKIMGFIGSILLIGLLVLSAMDAVRFGWSNVIYPVKIIGFILLYCSFYLMFRVFRENSYASRIIEVDKEKGQYVISTGPYRYVRHPMYVGSILMYIGVPLALGSYYSLIISFIYVVLIIHRVMNEEKLMINELEGYKEYMENTKYRLIPGIW